MLKCDLLVDSKDLRATLLKLKKMMILQFF